MGAGISANFINGLFVSSFITIGSLFFLVVLGSLAAYGLARNPGKIRDILYISFVVQIIIQSQLGIVPIYTFMLKIGIAGSIGGMIILYTFKQMPMTIFLYTGFFQSFPFNFEEAAMIDGATWKQAFMKIVMPQMNTITGTVLLMNSIYIWNDTFDQIVFLSGTQHQTLPVLIYTLTTQMTAQWNIIFAAVIISLLPMLLLYLFTQKKMIASFAGGIKG
jgi:raffinose/stachyose/melibiose transport system permease protein